MLDALCRGAGAVEEGGRVIRVGERDDLHRDRAAGGDELGPDGAKVLWVLAPSGFEDFIEDVSVPAEAPTVPPADVLPPENAAEIVLCHGIELLPE